MNDEFLEEHERAAEQVVTGLFSRRNKGDIAAIVASMNRYVEADEVVPPYQVKLWRDDLRATLMAGAA